MADISSKKSNKASAFAMLMDDDMDDSDMDVQSEEEVKAVSWSPTHNMILSHWLLMFMWHGHFG